MRIAVHRGHVVPKPLLILDLDETLLHASEVQLAETEDFRIDRYWVYLRPGLDSFLRECQSWYRMAIWSSAGDDYVGAMVQQAIAPIVPLEFVWARSRGTLRRDFTYDEYFYAKDLYKVKRKGYPLARVLIVDDSPRKVAKNYGNAIYVPPFEGAKDDEVLSHLSNYLHSLAFESDVRRIEKRQWLRDSRKGSNGKRP